VRARPLYAGLLRLLGGVVLIAVLLSAAGVPFVVALGRTAELAQDRLDSIEDLPEVVPAQRSTLLAADGSWLATFYAQNRVVVAPETIPAVLVDAVLSVEDTRFYDHRGVDSRGTARALVANLRSGSAGQGGSTITQQYVKNVLASAAENPEQAAEAGVKTLGRKLREARYALEFERTHTKAEILSGYLNIAYFGQGSWGVEAAAQTYFGIPVTALSASQAAFLAGQLQSPSRTDPVKHPEAALRRRNSVLAKMVSTKRLTSALAATAEAEPLGLQLTPPNNGCPKSPYPYFCDAVIAELVNDADFGATPQDRRERLYRGGLTITTTLDPRVQVGVQSAVDRLTHTDRVAAVAVTVQPGTGNVQALAVNRDYGTAENQSVYPFATRPSHPAGSTFKAFTLIAALESGLRLDTTVPGGSSWKSTKFDNPASGAYTNAEAGGRTNVSIADATTHSQNTAFVQIEERVGLQAVADAARRAGVTNLAQTGRNAVGDREGSLTLGARSVSVLDMANSYATLAAHGMHCKPTTVTEVRLADGTTQAHQTNCERTIDAAVADTATAALQSVVSEGTGRAASTGLRPVAGKTGTSDNFGSAWFVGYTPQFATAVMLGDPNGPANALYEVDGVAKVFGGTIPAEIFAVAMAQAHDGLDVVAFAPKNPDHLLAVTATRTVPQVVGLRFDLAEAKLLAVNLAVTRSTVRSPGVRSGVVVAQRQTPDGVQLDVTG
jgi:membrane peptidoglycan carboxypeptidase